MNLYQLTGEWMSLMQMAEEPDMDEDSFFGMKELIEADIEAKADGYAKIMRQLEADIEAVDAELTRLTKFKKGLTNNKEKLNRDLMNSMKATDKVKFKTELFSFNIKKNPPALKLKEGITTNDIDPVYIKWGEPSIDKTAVKEAVKAGATLDWAWLEQGESLQIK